MATRQQKRQLETAAAAVVSAPSVVQRRRLQGTEAADAAALTRAQKAAATRERKAATAARNTVLNAASPVVAERVPALTEPLDLGAHSSEVEDRIGNDNEEDQLENGLISLDSAQAEPDLQPSSQLQLYLRDNSFSETVVETLGNLIIGDLLLASREDMVALLGLSDGVRLFLRLKSYTAGQPPSEPEIVFLGNQPKPQRTFPEESSRSGNFPFSNLDRQFVYHPSKSLGLGKVRLAGTLVRLCGPDRSNFYTDMNNVDYTGTDVLDKINSIFVVYSMSPLIAGLADPLKEVKSTIHLLPRTKHCHAFAKVEIFEKVLACTGSLNAAGGLSLKSFSSNPKHLTDLGDAYNLDSFECIVSALSGVENFYTMLGGNSYVSFLQEVRNWVSSNEAARFGPDYIWFTLEVGFYTFLLAISTLDHLDPSVAIYAARKQAGWVEYFSLCLLEVTKITRDGEHDFRKFTIPTLAGTLGQPTQKRTRDGTSSVTGRTPVTPQAPKALCGRHLGGQLALLHNGRLLDCKSKNGRKCPHAHVVLKDYTKQMLLARLDSLPVELRDLITPAAKAFTGYKK